LEERQGWHEIRSPKTEIRMKPEIRNPKLVAVACGVLDCGGKAKRRHRLGSLAGEEESSVALRFPPQSKPSGSVIARRRLRLSDLEFVSAFGFRASVFLP
jgi:hypothetical protein